MASSRKRRKESKIDRRQQAPPPPGPFRHRDGDRRRRTGPMVREALELKRRMREFGTPFPPDDPPDADD